MTAINEQVQKILAKAKVTVVSQTKVQDRNAKGHFIPGTARMRLVLDGHGVSDPFKRTYFRNKRLPKIQEVVKSASLPRVRKNSGQVVLEMAV